MLQRRTHEAICLRDTAIAEALDAVVPYVELEPLVVAERLIMILIMILNADETITVNVNSD